VISLHNERIEPQLQPHFFDACEQLTIWLKTALEGYVSLLLGLDIRLVFIRELKTFVSREICIRVYASTERVGYDVAPWTGIEEAYEDFLKVLAEKVCHFIKIEPKSEFQVIPFLYRLLETSQLEFQVELHLPIISIRTLFSLESEIPIPFSDYADGGVP
jgi:hypothetical protein